MSFEVILGLDPSVVEVNQDGLARLCVLQTEVLVLGSKPVGEVLLDWMEIGHTALECHVHFPHGGIVSDPQQPVPRVSLVDVQGGASTHGQLCQSSPSPLPLHHTPFFVNG